ncbi:Nif3-like dinuclear metal center hexameric protein [Ectothiorhodospiraceae bacterium BW-2]|nr:Nif3-like dinuclear metal center hexameric protein [Ectothiorhodospiraceae bacterium BW-2]
MLLSELCRYLDQLLCVAQFKDYAPNGLQVEGRGEVLRLVTGVSASLSLIEAAVARGADAILVHHGYFWRGEAAVITGVKKRRLQQLLRHDMSLLAYHLPLDAHPELGNNAQLGRRWQLEPVSYCGEGDLVAVAQLPEPVSLSSLASRIGHDLGRAVQVLLGDGRGVQRVAWCSGGAQSYFQAAIEAGADCFISGEVSEPCFYLAQESGVAYLAAGHHATERYGVQAVGERLSQQFDLTVQFVDSDNPV